MSTGFDAPHVWPLPGDPARVEVQMHAWAQVAARIAADEDRAFAEAFPGTPAGRAMLEGVFGGSPFLGACLLAEPAFLRRLWCEGPERCVAELLATLGGMPPETSQEEAGRVLRSVRRRAALAVALADLSGVWEVEQVTGSLSGLAEAASSAALRVLLARLAKRGVLLLPDPGDPESGSGVIALGLGKLGGRELNYSSDIDLILLYDPEVLPVKERSEGQHQLIRLARAFVALLSHRSAEGYAFRVDLRLRPDPGATPLVVSTEAAGHYYEGRGRTWERAALIKARPIAGDRVAANAFLSRLAPFVWRRHLDFATVQELHEMKRQIDAQHRGRRIEPHGHDLKLGRGGIREIEFFAQAHQLTWGGQDRRLRVIPTCEVLRALVASGRVPERVAEAFIAAYRFLRRAEHRVQMVRDEQTHALPEDPAAFRALTRFLGYRDEQTFVAELLAHLRRVEEHYAEFFEVPLEVTGRGAPDAGDPETAAQLGRMGFAHPDAAAAILATWQSGRYPAIEDARERELLHTLSPALLTAMLGTADPDLALARFDRLLSRLPAGLHLLPLFQANLHVMETVAEILISAPLIGERLAEHPARFDALLEAGAEGEVPERAALEADLAGHLVPGACAEEDFESVRRWAEAAHLRAGIRMLSRRLDPLAVPALLRDLSDCALRALFSRVSEEQARRHGRIEGAEVALLAGEGPQGQDLEGALALDPVLVYDAPEETESDGEAPLTAPEYYRRLLGRLRAGLGARPAEGEPPPLAAGPSEEGSGTLPMPVATFERHHAETAEIRSLLALLRLRIVAGDDAIVARLRDGMLRAVRVRRDPAGLRRGLVAMRERGDGELRTENAWLLAHYRDGFADLEGLVRYLQLREAPAAPEVLAADTGEGLRRLAEAGALPPEEARPLLESWRLWTRVRALGGLLSEDTGPDDVPEGLRPLFESAAQIESFASLDARLQAAAAEVREIFTRRCATPPAA